MKRSLSLLLASLMLVSALTACGRRNNTPQDNGQNGNQSESAVVGGETATNDNTNGTTNENNGTDNNTNTQDNHPVLDDLENAGENVVQGAGDVGKAVTDGVRDAGDALTGNNSRSANRTADSTTYNQKLSNNGTLKQNGNVVTFQNPVLPGIF